MSLPAAAVPKSTAARCAPASPSDPRWAALRARDASADGSFVYAVATTRVYCRPSCAARPARPENVSFHDTAAAAEAFGFRACKRCRPDGPSRAGRAAALVADLCRYIANRQEIPALAELARRAGLSPHHTHRLFKACTGVTPRAYALEQRAERMRRALRTAPSVTAAIYDAGYSSSGRFYAEADARLGMTPRHFKAGGEAELIAFALAPSSLGSVLVAATARGVCAIALGDSPEPLRRDLERRFPRAELRPGDAAFAKLVAQAVALVEGQATGAALPLDLRGTAFQQRVWAALRDIPSGRIRSYAQVASSLGSPGAARAVAAACAANPVAVAVPCHRVIRGDGQLAGYRWGLERKRKLLEREVERGPPTAKVGPGRPQR